MENHLRVNQPSFVGVSLERPVVLERPSDTIPLLDERMRKLLRRKAFRARPAKMPHHNERPAWGTFNVQLRNLPRGAVVLGRVRSAARVSHVHGQRAVLEAREAPAVLVSPLVRRPDRT